MRIGRHQSKRRMSKICAMVEEPKEGDKGRD
jgi:hypothetical protein